MGIQWWVYLLAAGVLLVTFAGVNEYLKNKDAAGLAKRAGKWLDRFRDWD